MATIAEFYDMNGLAREVGDNHYRCTPLMDQLHFAICAPVAAVDVFSMCLLKRPQGLRVPLSPQELIDHTDEPEAVLDLFEHMQFNGLTTLEHYAFIRMKCRDPRPLYPGERYKLLDYNHVDTEVDKSIIRSLANDIPVYGSMCTKIPDEELTFEEWKEVVIPFPGHKATKGNHVVVIYGYDFKSDNPYGHAFKIKNSWGEEWGQAGYSRVTPGSFYRVVIPVI